MSAINDRYTVVVTVVVYDNHKECKEVSSSMISTGAAAFRTYKQAQSWKEKIVKALLAIEDICLKRGA